MRHIKFAGYKIRVPAHPLARAALGVALIIGGVFSFLPILGAWMLPLGLIVLSIDSALIRHQRRKLSVRLGRWMLPRWPKLANAIGFHAAKT